MRQLAAGILSIVLIILLISCKSKEEEIKPEEHTVAIGGIREAVICDGVIEPEATIEIKSKANGVLEFKGFEVGDVVKAGDLMYRLDKSLIEQSVIQAQAELKSARAQLASARRDQTREEKIQLENSVAQAKLDLEDAEEYLTRIKDLHAREYATDQELDDAESKYNKAKLSLELAERRLAESNKGGEEESIEVAESRVTLAEASLKTVMEELAETDIVAPIDGVILAQDVEVGDTITSATRGSAAGSVLCTYGDLSQVYLQGYVDETDIGRVKVGMPAEVNINSYPGRTFEGKLAKIYPQAETQQGVTAFKVDIELTGKGFVTRQTMDTDAKVITPESISESEPENSDSNEVGEGKDKSTESPAESKETKPDESKNTDTADNGKKTEDSKKKDDTKKPEGGTGKDTAKPGGGPPDGKGGNGKPGKPGKEGGGGAGLPVEIRAGMSADAEIIIRDVPEALIIPVTFVNFREQPPTVNLKDDSKEGFAPVKVAVGFTDGVNIVVEDGLKEGDIIIRIPRKEKEPLRR